ncbi:MAG: hypothetical protein OEM63_03515, partial [Gammaproteobacteria bacterium]|nr:hypothetical protein [Gammaproteobacteria bacterium]
RYMAYLVSQKLLQRFSVIATIAVVDSVEIAEWLITNRLGTIIPDERRSNDSEAAIDSAAELVKELRSIPGISGVNFAFSGSLDSIPEVLTRSGSSSS